MSKDIRSNIWGVWSARRTAYKVWRFDGAQLTRVEAEAIATQQRREEREAIVVPYHHNLDY